MLPYQVAEVLRTSDALVLSEDGTRVRRAQALASTEDIAAALDARSLYAGAAYIFKGLGSLGGWKNQILSLMLSANHPYAWYMVLGSSPFAQHHAASADRAALPIKMSLNVPLTMCRSCMQHAQAMHWQKRMHVARTVFDRLSRVRGASWGTCMPPQ